MDYYGTEGRPAQASRSVSQSIKRGLKCRCPKCGDGKLFSTYLRPVEACAVCKEEMFHQRADDFPPYLTIFIVGHIVVGLYMAVEQMITLEMWQSMAIFIPITGILCLAMLQPLKGGVIGLQWALKMHGFGGVDEDAIAAGLIAKEEAL